MDLNPNELDRHITGNYGEDQFQGQRECPTCEGTCTLPVIDLDPVRTIDEVACPRCNGEGYIEIDIPERPEDIPSDWD